MRAATIAIAIARSSLASQPARAAIAGAIASSIASRIGKSGSAIAKLDRADRATALKFIVHFIGDLHQPFHALGVGRGGNDVKVRVFGEANCGNDPAKPNPCNLHSVWDGRLIARRALDDARVSRASCRN